MEGRTAVWHENLLIGREEYVVPLVEASLSLHEARYSGDSQVLNVTIENTSDATYILKNQSDFTFHTGADVVTLPPHSTTNVYVKTLSRLPSISLPFEILNAVTAPNTHPVITLTIPAE